MGITTDRARLASRIEVEVEVRAFRNADATTRDLRYGRVLGLLDARLVKAAELPRITLHQVRHSFSTIALEQGVDVLYVSELLGHSSAAIT